MYRRTFLVGHGTVGAVGTALVYLVGGHLVLDGVITLGTLVALGTYVVRLYAPLTGPVERPGRHPDAPSCQFDRVFEVLDMPDPINDRPGAVELSPPAGRIELDDVRFRYPSRRGSRRRR